ncbi:MAG: SDR family oxidoreductase [Gammaproteobacteria bacterium]
MGMTCDGKVALVTGGASGIGRATACLLAQAGARVMVADVNLQGCEETVDMIATAGGQAAARRVDVADEQDVAQLVADCAARFGRLDLAFNNAGISGPFMRTAEYPTEDWQRVLAVNLTGVWLCMKYEIRQMLTHGGGAIVNTASAAGLMGMRAAPAYVAAKHGVVGLTRCAALDYARSKVRINAVCPGGVRTGMTEDADARHPGWLDGIAKQEPMGRIAEPDEIARAVVWLLSDEASFVTGHAMAVDGGLVSR